MRKRNLGVLFGIFIMTVTISSFTTKNQQGDDRPTNLKVLPKNISNEDLEATMKNFNMALGVKCNHCHAPKSNGEKGLDFASDANKMKDVAREMIKMTNKINKKYFGKHAHDGVMRQIGCTTCHNGAAEPKMFSQS